MELSLDHRDALRELINIGVGKAADVLNSMMEAHITLAVPEISLVSSDRLKHQIAGESVDSPVSAVRLGFKGPFSGTAALVFPVDSAAKLVTVLTGEGDADDDMDAIRVGTLTEVGNIVMNGVMGSIGNVLNERLDYAVPSYLEDSAANVVGVAGMDLHDVALLAEARFVIRELHIDGGIVMFFGVGSLDALLAAIDKLIDDVASTH